MSESPELQVYNQKSEITLYEGLQDPIKACQDLGHMFARSGFFGCEKVEQGQVLALACLSEKKSPFELMRTYHLIGGKLEMKASAMLAEFKKRGGKVRWSSGLMDRDKASAVFEKDGEEFSATYTIEDAKIEGHLNKNGNVWAKSAPDMLRARLVSKVIRMLDPEINSGFYDQNEMPIDQVAGVRDVSGKADDLLSKTEDPPPTDVFVETEPVVEPVVESEPTADDVDMSMEAMDKVEKTVEQPEAKPEPEQKEEAKPESPAENRDNKTGKVEARLEEMLGADQDKATAFMLKKGVIQEGQKWFDADDAYLKKMLSNFDAFKTAAKIG